MSVFENEINREQNAIAQGIEHKSRRLSIVWLLPLFALLVGGWILWQALLNSGVTISIDFPDAQGLEENKTPVIFHGLEVGVVKKINIKPDLSAVSVTVRMNKQMSPFVTKSSKFWLVTPKLSVKEISGLETLISGNYIGFQPGSKKSPKIQKFIASKNTSIIEGSGGLHLKLKTKELHSISQGSPIYYRRINVGEVLDYQLNPDGDTIMVDVFIEPKFAHLVTPDSKFWNASGIELSANLSNLKLKIESLLSLLRGGIAFYTPDLKSPETVKSGSVYPLYNSFASAQSGIPIKVKFPITADIKPDFTHLKYFGMDAGVVTHVELDKNLKQLTATINVDPRLDKVLTKDTSFWLAKPQLSLSGIKRLDTLVKGSYISMDMPIDLIDKDYQPVRVFTASEKPSRTTILEDSFSVTLTANNLDGISIGSPVLYKKIEIGNVSGYRLTSNAEKIEITASIENKYKQLINQSTRFWNNGGVKIEGGLSGLKLDIATLSSLIKGGISAETTNVSGKPLTKESVATFTLFPSRKEAMERGVFVDVEFNNVQGIKKGMNVVYKGINVGSVKKLNVKTDAQKKAITAINAHILLKSQFNWLADSGSKFWLVKPKIGLTEVSNLETLISGYYIAVQSSRNKGSKQYKFTALNDSYSGFEAQPNDLRIKLLAANLGSLKRGSPILFRGVVVGKIIDYQLAPTANNVVLYGAIDRRYSNVVQEESKFWNVSGVNFSFGLFSGAKVESNSVEALLAGGIAFATPDSSKPVDNNYQFQLYNTPKESWLKWHPVILLADKNNDGIKTASLKH